MVEAATNTIIAAHQHAKLERENAALRSGARKSSSINWRGSKRQLFGRKSEKRLIESPAHSGLLFDTLPESARGRYRPNRSNYTRRKGAKERGDAVTDSGLRFAEDVPVEVIHVNDPPDIPVPSRKNIGKSSMRRSRVDWLRRPGSYVVIE